MTLRGKAPKIVLFSLVVSLIACALSLFANRHGWAGWAPSAFITSQDIITLFGGVCVAGFSSYLAYPEGSRTHRDTLAISVRSHVETSLPHLVVATVLGSTLSIVSAGATIGIDSLVLGTRVDLGFDAPLWILWAAGTAFYLAFCALLGTLLGRLIRSFLAIIAAMLSAYLIVWIPVMSFAPPRWSGLGPYQGTLWLEISQSWLTAAIRASFWAVMALGLALILTKRVRRPSALLLPVCAILGLAILDGNPVETPVPSASTEICSESTPRVCTSPNGHVALPALTEYVDEFTRVLPADLRPAEASTSGDFTSHYEPGGTLALASAGGMFVTSNIPVRSQVLVDATSQLSTARCTDTSEGNLDALTVQLALLDRLGLDENALQQPWDSVNELDLLASTLR